MAKENLNERFQQLAGIKPLYEKETDPTTKGNDDDSTPVDPELSGEGLKEKLMNEGVEMWQLLGSVLGILGTAGITAQLEVMLEDPTFAEKYPKLAKLFGALKVIGNSSLVKGIK